MKALTFLMILGFVFGLAAQAEAAGSSIDHGRSIAGVSKKKLPSKKTKTKKAVRKAAKTKSAPVDRTRGTLKTDISFDDNVLHGKYQMPDESLVKVESEKGLSDLLGARKHFKDRLSEASEQE